MGEPTRSFQKDLSSTFFPPSLPPFLSFLFLFSSLLKFVFLGNMAHAVIKKSRNTKGFFAHFFSLVQACFLSDFLYNLWAKLQCIQCPQTPLTLSFNNHIYCHSTLPKSWQLLVSSVSRLLHFKWISTLGCLHWPFLLSSFSFPVPPGCCVCPLCSYSWLSGVLYGSATEGSTVHLSKDIWVLAVTDKAVHSCRDFFVNMS